MKNKLNIQKPIMQAAKVHTRIQFGVYRKVYDAKDA